MINIRADGAISPLSLVTTLERSFYFNLGSILRRKMFAENDPVISLPHCVGHSLETKTCVYFEDKANHY
jgi:hypothetical protein